MELDYALLALAKAPDGLAVWFYDRQIPFKASSCFERLEYLIKRLSRAKLLPALEEVRLLRDIQSRWTHPLFEPLRADVAHGPFRGLGRGGWLDQTTRDRGWELMTLAGEDGSGMIQALLADDPNRQLRRIAAMDPFVDGIRAITTDVLTQLLSAVQK